ncbi:hypothetical protein I41_16320 [Lacipirellula limnantheis]|uniref:Uncharacterized protein n=1 Tax=Lacipirellula limnantheis TaxID=2528024 RepID=A0A517TVQ6_9BACT|nr:hypothetical protein I41_16320 [Lacipirellula limnantheis]
MAKYVRYALATICFAASVGCLALRWRSCERWEILNGPIYVTQSRMLNLQSFSGTGLILLVSENMGVSPSWIYTPMGRPETRHDNVSQRMKSHGSFGSLGPAVYFPLWYPALISALAGVGVLRFRLRFSIRSALCTTTIVAVLIGMAVIL